MGPPRYGRQANGWELDLFGLRPRILGRLPLTIWKKFFWVQTSNNKHFALQARGFSLKGLVLPFTHSPFDSDASRVALKVIGSSRTGN